MGRVVAGTSPGIRRVSKGIGWTRSGQSARLFHVKHLAVERFVRAHGWPPGANRDEVVRRVLAWDAQAAKIRRTYGPLELENSRQRLLPFNCSLKNT